MSEAAAVARAETPATVDSLAVDLAALGVRPGSVLLVHSSLSALGWVCGDAVAVILALDSILGVAGTLVMPAHSSGLTDPAAWQNPPVPRHWWQTIRDTMPAFDPAVTPTRGVGRIPEIFRRLPGVLRSGHPVVSFAARGPQAEQIVDDHRLEHGLGEASPLARLYELDAKVLLLGVDHGANTSLHLAEHRCDYPGKAVSRQGSPMLVDGERRWTWYEDVDTDADDFPRLGTDFVEQSEAADLCRGRVACASAELMSQRAVVDFAVEWLPRQRTC